MAVKMEKTINQASDIIVNYLSVTLIADEESIGYLGLDENVSYNGSGKRSCVTKEYQSRLKKVWIAELSPLKIPVTHSVFVVPEDIETFGLFD